MEIMDKSCIFRLAYWGEYIENDVTRHHLVPLCPFFTKMSGTVFLHYIMLRCKHKVMSFTSFDILEIHNKKQEIFLFIQVMLKI